MVFAPPPPVWIMAALVAVMGWVAEDATAGLDFSPWEPLGGGQAIAEGTSLLSKGWVVLVGGYVAPGVSTNGAVTISATRSLSWEAFPSLTLPVPLGGVFATIANNFVFVSVMSTNNFTMGDEASDPVVYVTSYVDPAPVWERVTLDPAFAPRRRAGMLAHEGSIFLVGGVNAITKEFIPNVLRFDHQNNSWSVSRSLSDLNNTVCDCFGHVLKTCFTTLMCRRCEDGMDNMEVFVFNPCTGALLSFGVAMTPNNTVSIASTTIGHYVFALITLPNAQPIPIYLDMFLSQMNALGDSAGFRPRHHGTMFTLSNAVYYAGGYDPQTGEPSTAVDYAVAVPSQYASVDRDDRTYTVGDTITITTETCRPGTTIQLSDCPMCMNPITQSVACSLNNGSSSGVATLVANSPAPTAYVCMAYGVCTLNASLRQPCYQPAGDFETCKDYGCCWDNTDQTCFAFSVGDPNDMFFNVVSPIVPLTIVAPIVPVVPNRVADFLKSPGGIIMLTIIGLAIVLGAVGAAWFVVVPRNSSDDDDDEDGHPLDQYGKYKLVKKLGQGGFGQVFLVRRKRDNVLLALKYIITPDETERNYAVKEFEMLHGAQGHPNMIHLEEMLINWSLDNNEAQGTINSGTAAVAVLGDKKADAAAANKKPQSKKGEQVPLLQFAPRYVCIIMEYCPEGDLSSYILSSMDAKGKRGLPEAMVLNVVCKQICELLIHLHNRSPPIVHRDMKPENILLKNNATQVVVTDFGLAQQLEKSYMTTRAGSLHYVAPECWKKKYTSTVDMWALGCILYGCCTGRVTAKTARVMFSDARNRSFSREVSAELSNYSSLTRSIILGLLRPDPTARLTANQVLEMLKQDPKQQPPK